jgi:large subunit ribosomal protein L5
MRQIKVEKVTVNIGVGSAGESLENAKTLLERITGKKVVETKAKRRNPAFKLRPGLPIGVKVTLRGEDAINFLKRALAAKKNKLKASNFDEFGNFSFGIHEYIDLPGVKYDPSIGLYGFDVCVTLQRPGKRVALRRRKKSKIGKKHFIKKEEGINFVRETFGVTVEG